ncbi:hypothetical protein ASZ90_010387 [hydrocarbon metagenome]|uniref:Uncharacterized protein n=1 Tax=hydrocarbon metagenome TaxID=938273 RepID=A0A0W8FG84_9ZZZZ|nr:hypothetical protein [Methanomicrobiaceae archaeon]
MPRSAYIALLGRSTWALVNTYYAVLREMGLRPARVYILAEEPYAGSAPVVREAVGILSDSYGFSPDIDLITVPEADFTGAGNAIRSLAEDLTRDGFSVALDITSGRKAMVAGALITISRAHLDVSHIYYLAVKAENEIAKPYMMIPQKAQQVRDFMEDAEMMVGR